MVNTNPVQTSVPQGGHWLPNLINGLPWLFAIFIVLILVGIAVAVVVARAWWRG